jgi:altronate dehydratase large subunit
MNVSGQDFFLGYERSDGKIGTRNRLLVIAPIDCSIELARKIAEKVEDSVAVTQTYGCREDSMLISQFVGSAKNPNIAGVLIVGLGCETLTGELLKEKIEDSGKPVHNITIQDEGGTVNTLEKGVNILKKMRMDANNLKREPFPLNKLTLALECGGSDTTSGLAANPALGIAANKLLDAGGTVIFGETQEMIGTQHILAKRAVNKQVADDIYKIIEDQMARLKARGIESRWMSKGNIDGGLTTIEEKSLGSIQKGGTNPIQGVLYNNWDRFDTPGKPGLYIMDGPSFDVASVTHLVAAGAQIVCFTSGRGSTTGHAIAPVIKITGNSSTYDKLEDNIDINAGSVLDGSESLNDVGERIFNKIIHTASGEQTKAEIHGLYEFNIYRKNRATEHLLGHC